MERRKPDKGISNFCSFLIIASVFGGVMLAFMVFVTLGEKPPPTPTNAPKQSPPRSPNCEGIQLVETRTAVKDYQLYIPKGTTPLAYLVFTCRMEQSSVGTVCVRRQDLGTVGATRVR
jgi:hypothetical protein